MLIFLDIDGVMVPAKSWERPELLNDGFPAFSLKAVRVLQSLITDDTTVVLTTSHKTRFAIEEWKDIFEKRGLKVDKLKSLADNTNMLSRKDEVLNWFNLNTTNEEFVIIDDDKSLNDLPDFLKGNLILTSPMIGLTNSHLDEIKVALSRKLLIG
jgi:hypothetical protein